MSPFNAVIDGQYVVTIEIAALSPPGECRGHGIGGKHKTNPNGAIISYFWRRRFWQLVLKTVACMNEILLDEYSSKETQKLPAMTQELKSHEIWQHRACGKQTTKMADRWVNKQSYLQPCSEAWDSENKMCYAITIFCCNQYQLPIWFDVHMLGWVETYPVHMQSMLLRSEFLRALRHSYELNTLYAEMAKFAIAQALRNEWGFQSQNVLNRRTSIFLL